MRATGGWREVLPAQSDTEVRRGWGGKGQSQAVARLVQASTRSWQPTTPKAHERGPPSRHVSPGIPHFNSLLHPSLKSRATLDCLLQEGRDPADMKLLY